MDYAAILTRKFKANWALDGDNYEGLIWLDESEKPTKELLESYWKEVKKEIDNEAAKKIKDKNLLLEKLGITAEEAALLLS